MLWFRNLAAQYSTILFGSIDKLFQFESTGCLRQLVYRWALQGWYNRNIGERCSNGAEAEWSSAAHQNIYSIAGIQQEMPRGRGYRHFQLVVEKGRIYNLGSCSAIWAERHFILRPRELIQSWMKVVGLTLEPAKTGLEPIVRLDWRGLESG